MNGHRLFQDNDPKHTARSTTHFMQQNNINWWKTPAESPDLNPIENVWHQLKTHIRKTVKPKTKDELIQGIKEFWGSVVTPSLCQKYISHLQKVLPVVVARNGKATGF